MNGARAIAWALVAWLIVGGVACEKKHQQGWTDQERRAFYHWSQGTKLIPYAWYMALEQQDGKPFRADEHLSRYGFLPDSQDRRYNPDALPVGFTTGDGVSIYSPMDLRKKMKWVGLTCAACHTSELTHQGKHIRIEGGASYQNNLLFLRAMRDALQETVSNEQKLARFSNAIKQIDPDSPPAAHLEKAIRGFTFVVSGEAAKANALKNCKDPQLHKIYQDKSFSPYPAETWGFGRLDAFGRANITIFAPLHPCNLEAADAPVSIPKIWNAWKYDWVQWNRSAENALARNVAQAAALGANPVSLEALGWLEHTIEKLLPPVWPEAVLGPINRQLAEKGKALYHGMDGKGLCARCHMLRSHVSACDGKDELVTKAIPIAFIGTDDRTAMSFTRSRNTGTNPPDFVQKEIDIMPAEYMQRMTDKLIKGGAEAEKIKPEALLAMQRCRTKNRWEARMAYKTPPHDGIWATPPYLHNGSVPNVYQLLLPQKQRASTFCVGPAVEYDTKQVGFPVTDQCDEQYKFRTSKPGNLNIGHEFRNWTGEKKPSGVLDRELSDDERTAIIEYLKTL